MYGTAGTTNQNYSGLYQSSYYPGAYSTHSGSLERGSQIEQQLRSLSLQLDRLLNFLGNNQGRNKMATGGEGVHGFFGNYAQNQHTAHWQQPAAMTPSSFTQQHYSPWGKIYSLTSMLGQVKNQLQNLELIISQSSTQTIQGAMNGLSQASRSIEASQILKRMEGIIDEIYRNAQYQKNLQQ